LVLTAEARDDTAVETLPTSGQCTTLIQDSHDLFIGAMIGQSINLGDNLCWCCSELPGCQWPWQRQGLRRAAVEADMSCDPTAADECYVG
jgi:hypothetical protein